MDASLYFAFVFSGDCVRTTGGNGGGACCYFPFTYKGKTYTSCTAENHSDQLWCVTDGDDPTKWGNCVTGKKVNTSWTKIVSSCGLGIYWATAKSEMEYYIIKVDDFFVFFFLHCNSLIHKPFRYFGFFGTFNEHRALKLKNVGHGRLNINIQPVMGRRELIWSLYDQSGLTEVGVLGYIFSLLNSGSGNRLP